MGNIILKIGCIAILLSTGSICYAQMPDTYSEHTSGNLEYGWFIPENYDPTVSYPVVIYLHGWSNNYTVYLDFYNQDIQLKNPCFVYTPKTPVDWGDWSSWSWEGTGFSSLSIPTQTAVNVLDSLISIYSIDTNRLYVYGISMGGEGVFDLLHKMPQKFAAGISICGGGFAHWAGNIALTPIWMFHGSADDINPPEITERIYNELVNMGATRMRYTNYPGYGHAIWDKAQSEPSFYDWMFAFNKSQTEYAAPQGQINLSGSVNDKIELQWNDIRNESIIADKIWYYNVFNTNGLLTTVEYNVTNYRFTPLNNIDTFKIQAVNYNFEKSEFSNPLYFSDGTLITSLSDTVTRKKVQILRNSSSITIDLFDHTDTPVTVQLVSLEGRILLTKEYSSSDHIILDATKYEKQIIIVNVIIDNQSYSEKVMPE